MKKAILFDLEGVLIDTEPLHFRAHQYALKKFGITISKEDYITYGAYKSSVEFYSKMSLKYHRNVLIEDAKNIKKPYYHNLLDCVPLSKGTENLLQTLAATYSLAIVSSTSMDTIIKILSSTILTRYFKDIISGDDIDRNKPAPDIYLLALKILQRPATACIAIEDSEIGVQAAKSAGIKCIAVPNEYTIKQDFSKANLIVTSLEYVNPNTIESLLNSTGVDNNIV